MPAETIQSPAFFVSPLGRDSWSGQLAQPNAEGTDGPFATMERARDAMRWSGISTTYVRAGTYALAGTLQLDGRDSGHKFLGYPGEAPVLSGGQRITGFTAEGGGNFSAAVSGGATGLDVSVGSVRQHAAQSGAPSPSDPTSGYFWADAAIGGPSKRSFTFRAGDIRPEDVKPGTLVQIFDRERLTDDIAAIDHVDFATNSVYLASDTWYPPRDGSTFRLLNNAAFVRGAGEFGWRAADQRLVVQPTDAGALLRDGAVVARLGTLIDITGASGITIQGLTFSDTTWNGSAAVRLTNANGNRIGGNRFVNVGNALSLSGSSQNLIGGNTLQRLGANGITLNPGSDDNRIYANTIEHVGEVSKYVAGISGNGINNNIFSNNDIRWSARDGIAIKNWSAQTMNTGNVIEYNQIAHTGQETADAAAISVLGRSDIDTHMTIRGNRIEDANGLATDARHSWLTDHKGFGIYLDDQTNGVAITDNFIDDADWAAVFIHGGDNNTVQNNIAVMHRNQQELIRIEWTPLAGDAGIPRNNSVTGNIAYGTVPVDDYWELVSANNPTVDRNLVFNSARRGAEDMSGDPGFVDVLHGDGRLMTASPAGLLGIHDLAWSKMGTSGYGAASDRPAFWTAGVQGTLRYPSLSRSQVSVQPSAGSSYSISAAGATMPVVGSQRIVCSDGVILLGLNDAIAAPVYRLYQAAFHRQPDEAGLSYYIDAYDRGGQLTDFAKCFMASPEGQSFFAGQSDSAFVDQLYHNVLGRSGESAGLAYYASFLSGGGGRDAVLTFFSAAPETQLLTASHAGAAGYWVL